MSASRLFIFAAATLMSGTAVAQHGAGLYVGAHIGEAKAQIDTAKDGQDLQGSGFANSGVSADDTTSGWSLIVGYRFNRYVAAEGAYVATSNFTESTTITAVGGTPVTPTPLNIKIKPRNIFTLAAVGMLPITDQFYPYAKVGVYQAKLDVESSAPSLGINQTQSATNHGWLGGAGIAFNITPYITVRGEYERLSKVGDENTTGQNNIDFISVGLVYNFR